MSSHRTVPMRDDAWRAGGDNLAPTPVTDWPQPWLGRLLLVSLLVMLNLPMTFTLITRTDPYGFFTLKSVSAYPLPLVLSTGLSSAMAVAGYRSIALLSCVAVNVWSLRVSFQLSPSGNITANWLPMMTRK